jgi:hypothetical protein
VGKKWGKLSKNDNLMQVKEKYLAIESCFMEKEKVINEGGINGSADGTIDYHSADFLALQAMIKASAEKLDETEKLNNTLLSIRFQMETSLREKE